MVASVLSKLNPSDFTTATLLSQLSASFQARATSETNTISSSFTQKISSLEARAAKWRTVQNDIGEATTKISGVVGRVKQIISGIDSMIRTVNRAAGNADGFTNFQGYAASFDSLLKGQIRAAEQSLDSPNLLGEAPRSVKFPTNVFGATDTVFGAFLGSSYHIIDSQGKWWQPDHAAGLLRRYDSFPDQLSGETANLSTGLRVDSLSGDAITFTVGPNTGSPTTYTGTLQRTGLRLLDSAFYDGLATAEGRKRALADLNAAKSGAKLELVRYQASLTVANFYEDRAKAEMDGFTEGKSRQLIEQAKAVNKAQQRLARELQAAQGQVAQALAVKNSYNNLLTPFLKSKFSRALIKLTA